MASHLALAPAQPTQDSSSGLGLRGFDDSLQLLIGKPGVILANVADENLVGAVLSHARRRLEAGGHRVICVSTLPDRSLWREIALRLGVADLSSDVEIAVRRIEELFSQHKAALVGSMVGATDWDYSVLRALLCRSATRPIVLATLEPLAWAPSDVSQVKVSAELDADEITRWWSAASLSASNVSNRSWGQLEEWWFGALYDLSHSPEKNAQTAVRERLSSSELVAWQRLVLSGRAWPLNRLIELEVSPVDLQRLVLQGAVEVVGGVVVVRVFPETTLDGSLADRSVVAQALCQSFAKDPWAFARAAELWAESGAHDRAEQCHQRAIDLAHDTVARADLWSRWGRVIQRFVPEAQRECCLRAAELALVRGDADEALSWAQRAASLGQDAFASALMLGKASLGRGDLVAAGGALRRAVQLAATAEEQAEALAELAEVHYCEGKLAEAQKLAEQASSLTQNNRVRLRAKNTLGKLLLAQGDWSEAESRFACDELDAACANDEVAKLRARVNRAIALLSNGRVDEAGPMLESVLADAHRRNDQRAAAFALSNLAVLAINRHDYGLALKLSEQAIDERRRIGERLGLARVVANLAELRLRLGLVAEAEQALTFGQQAVSRRAPISRGADFALVQARIGLARGDTLSAHRDLAVALAGSSGSSDGDMKGDCLRLSVRIAIEDGDLERAAKDLDDATASACNQNALAEVALLRAYVARGRGEPAQSLVREAILLSRRVRDEELLREAHTLAAEMAMADGEIDEARNHVQTAVALRQRVLDGLPTELRPSYLARRDLARLSKLQDQCSSGPIASSEFVAPVSIVRATNSRKLIGNDPAIRSLLHAVKKIAPSDSTVLIHGESGTGKELVAEAIHQSSNRHQGPMVRVNCGALVESLLLSELFGHEKGSFTGANARKRGRFEVADGGTLFLDEIGDISPATQVALLRVLQERTFERVGGTAPIRADVRIICATHRDLKAMVERGEFREDLYFRLSGIVLEVPALRNRLGDLPAISQGLLDRIADERNEQPKQLSADAVALMNRHRWPGNIRELDNALRVASLFCDSQSISARELLEHVDTLRSLPTSSFSSGPLSRPSVEPLSGPISAPISCQSPPSSPVSDDFEEGEGPVPAGDAEATDRIYHHLKAGKAGLFDVKRQIERDCIARALAETRGNITRAAAILGMKRPRLSQLVKQYGLSAVSSEGT